MSSPYDAAWVDSSLCIIEIHLQWHSSTEWADVADTLWRTREFGLYDPNGNALFFYRDR